VSLLDRLQHDVTRVRPARLTDRRGDRVDDWTFATRTALAPAWVQQSSSTESRDERLVTVTRWTLYCRDLTLVARDRIEWDGRVFEVDGAPNALDGSPGIAHVEASLVLLEA